MAVTSNLMPATLEEALPDPERVAELQASLEAAGVRWILSCWVDLLGVPKTKPVPVHQLGKLCEGKGPQFAVHSVSMVPELGPADPDQIAIPDLDSLIICPWDETIAWVFSDLYWEGAPYNVCPRLALKRQVQRAALAGYHVNAGFEPEFIVLKEVDGKLVKAFGESAVTIEGKPVKLQAYGYDAEHSLEGLPFLEDVRLALDKLGWGLTNVVCEGAFSQFELDYHFCDAVQAADRFCFLRVMLKEIAKQHGLVVTYMPKPSDGDWRNGAHINHSLAPIGDPMGNAFADEDGGWADLTLSAVAGIERHGAAITAVACSTVNSYKGLVGRTDNLEGGTLTWAPTHICHGFNNRSAMIRLPQTRKAIENRACDTAVNPYLALAMTTGATLAGIQEELPAGAPIDKPLYDVSAAEAQELGIQLLPRTLLEAITAFAQDDLAKDVFGETMHTLYTRSKRDEWERFHEHVTAWEQAEYLRFF
jgi:glutamine synthetase